MFNVDPQERLTADDVAEFELDVALEQKRLIRYAAWVGAALFLNILCVVPFSKGHSLQEYWPIARYLVISALWLFVWFGMRVGFIWSSWQSARETRRGFRDPE